MSRTGVGTGGGVAAPAETMAQRMARLQADVVALNATSLQLRAGAAETVQLVRGCLAEVRRQRAAPAQDPARERDQDEGNDSM